MRNEAPSRRAVLGSLAAAGAAFGMRPIGLAAEPSPRRIDVHHHLEPPAFLAHERERLMSTIDTDITPVLTWTPERSLEAMDQFGVTAAVTSVTGLSAAGRDVGEIRKLARQCNEFAAEMTRDHPGRFGSFAALPMPDVDGSLAEIAYAFDTLRADGVGMITSYAGLWPGDPPFIPVFEELNRRKAVVFIHPTTPVCCASTLPGISPTLIEYLTDTTRAITSLLFGGIFQRFPDVRFIFCHAGGTIMPLVDRISRFQQRHKEYAAVAPQGVAHELARLHYDIATSTNAASLSALANVVPVSQILFGSDHPVVPLAATARGLDAIALADGERRAINRENAIALFPRFA